VRSGANVRSFFVNNIISGVITYEIRPRTDRKGFDLISEALPFGKLWYGDAEAAAGYAEFYSRSKDIEIRFFNESGELIETRKHAGNFREP
jgi:hypothetical protein